MPSLIDLMLEGRKAEQHGPWPRAVVDASVWQFALGNWRRDTGACSACGANPRRCTWRCWMKAPRTSPSSASIAPIAAIPRPADATRRRFDWSAPSMICSVYRPKACPIPALARSPQLGRPLPAGGSARHAAEGGSLPLPDGGGRRPASDRGRSRACGNYRARPFPLYRERREPWSGWNSGWDIPTRVSRGS